MTLKLDVIWQDDDSLQYRAHCANCSYRSAVFEDEEMATAAWFGHVCLQSTLVS